MYFSVERGSMKGDAGRVIFTSIKDCDTLLKNIHTPLKESTKKTKPDVTMSKGQRAFIEYCDKRIQRGEQIMVLLTGPPGMTLSFT